jgi:predicted ATPase
LSTAADREIGLRAVSSIACTVVEDHHSDVIVFHKGRRPMSQLFVSYASVDRSRALEIVEAIGSLGIEVWIDQAGIAGGTQYGTEIANALRDADAVVLIASGASLTSKNVRQEIMLAWRYDRPILPLILHPLVFPDDVAYWLEGAQWIEALDRPAAEWLPKLQQALVRHGIEVAPAAREAVPETESIPLQMRGNLPALSAPILGRVREIAELLTLLNNGRPVPHTGPGGTGKTRLALEVGRRLGPSYAGGVWFVDLSPVGTPALVLPALVDALDLEVAPDRSPLDAIAAALSDESALVLFDNLEQIPDIAAVVTELQVRMPALSLLSTSRVALGVQGEWVYAVPQLALPDLSRLPAPAELLQNPAVRLFVERATQAKPDFQFNDGNARAVAEICHRLDGLPLAIEIAAARTRMLPPAALLTRLGSRLNLLTRGSAASARQQTLRDTSGWSYQLLDAEQQRAFRDFAVFAGGATVEAAEAVLGRVCDAGVPEGCGDLMQLDLLDGLVDQSLLLVESTASGEARLRMLETIREYAIEQLDASQEREKAHDGHAAYFLELMERIEPELRSARDHRAGREVRADLGNLRAALGWTRERGDEGARIRLANALFAYWRIAGPYAEAEDELSGALQAAPDGLPIERADASSALGWLAAGSGDFQRAQELFGAALEMYRSHGMTRQEAEMEFQLALVAEFSTRYADARAHHLRRLELHRQLGDEAAVARVEHDLGVIARFEGDYDTSAMLIGKGLEAYRHAADAQKIAAALIDLSGTEMLNGSAAPALAHIDEAILLLNTMEDEHALMAATMVQGRARQLAGDYGGAQVSLEAGRAMAENMGDRYMLSMALYGLGVNAARQGAWAEATALLRESARLALESGDAWRIAEVLEELAGIEADQGDAAMGARMLGKAGKIREETGAAIPPAHVVHYEGTVAMLLEVLGDGGYEREYSTGREMVAETLVGAMMVGRASE